MAPHTSGQTTSTRCHPSSLPAMVMLMHRIVCVNGPYNTAYSTKDDQRDLRVPNIYMKLGNPFPSAREFKTLLCSISNKGRLQKLICSYLTDLAQNVYPEILYSVGSLCTNLSAQQPLHNYSFDQSEADTILFSIYAILRESGYSGPVVIDAADTDAYVAAAAISHQLPGMLCIKRKQETIFCRDLVTEEMADCIVQLHCFTARATAMVLLFLSPYITCRVNLKSSSSTFSPVSPQCESCRLATGLFATLSYTDDLPLP